MTWQLWQIALVVGNQQLNQAPIDAQVVFAGLLGNWDFFSQHCPPQYSEQLFVRAMHQRLKILAQWHIASWREDDLRPRSPQLRATLSCHNGFSDENLISMDEVCLIKLLPKLDRIQGSCREFRNCLHSTEVATSFTKSRRALEFVQKFSEQLEMEYLLIGNQRAILQASL